MSEPLEEEAEGQTALEEQRSRGTMYLEKLSNTMFTKNNFMREERSDDDGGKE